MPLQAGASSKLYLALFGSGIQNLIPVRQQHLRLFSSRMKQGKLEIAGKVLSYFVQVIYLNIATMKAHLLSYVSVRPISLNLWNHNVVLFFHLPPVPLLPAQKL